LKSSNYIGSCSLLAAIVFLAGCTNFSKNDVSTTAPSVLNPRLIPEIKASFYKRDINGCFILHDMENDTSIIYNQKRSKQQFLPASTYKILNSLIAMECKVVKDENEIIYWDSLKHPVAIWNQSHNMKTGIKYSVVWFYQELARRIGEERMQYWVNRAGYGNQQIGQNIDDFWLVGDLKITPLEQVEFLKQLVNEELPFTSENIKKVKEMIIEDEHDGYVFRAKTGWADFGIPVGWYIGYIEIKDHTYIFVNNIEIRSNQDAKARKEITREIFNAIFDIDLNI